MTPERQCIITRFFEKSHIHRPHHWPHHWSHNPRYLLSDAADEAREAILLITRLERERIVARTSLTTTTALGRCKIHLEVELFSDISSEKWWRILDMLGDYDLMGVGSYCFSVAIKYFIVEVNITFRMADGGPLAPICRGSRP